MTKRRTTSPLTLERDTFERECNEARDNAADVAAQQLIGLGVAKDNALAYKKRPPAAPWWTDLAEVAITMGVAGVAGVAARALGERIGKELIRLGAKATKPGDLKAVTGVTDALKEGMKRAGKQVFVSGSPGVRASNVPAIDTSRFSGNPTIEFFASQEAALARAQGAYRTLITSQQAMLRPVLRATPEVANQAMRSIAGALKEAEQAGAQAQQRATESQWISGLARSRHGQERVADAGSVTFLGGVRNEYGVSPHAVLQLVVALQHDVRTLDARGARPLSAAISGVSQEIADRLGGEPLATRPVPIKIEVLHLGGLIKSVITRDELGRVRVQGSLEAPDRKKHDLDGKPAPRNEAQAHQAAEEFVNSVLSTSLVDRGIKVHTDDATGLSTD